MVLAPQQHGARNAGVVLPDLRNFQARALSVPAYRRELSASDLDRQSYPGAQPRALGEEPRIERVSIAGREERKGGLEAVDLDGHLRDLRTVHVGRIAHHQIEKGEVEPGREVRVDQGDP